VHRSAGTIMSRPFQVSILTFLLRMTVFIAPVPDAVSANGAEVQTAAAPPTAPADQDESSPKDDASTPKPGTSPSNGTRGTSWSDQLGQVVVTAERLEEDVQHVPAAVVVLQGRDLRVQGRISVQQMLEDVPNVTYGLLAFQQSPDNPNQNISIRGIMATQQTGGLPGPAVVGTYVDDVFQGIGADYDLNHIEILYGPQGTLYGRSATAGVVAFHTNNPILKRFTTDLFAEYGTCRSAHG